MVSIAEWLSGVTRLPRTVSLKGSLQSGIRNPHSMSAPAQAAPAASSPKFQIKAQPVSAPAPSPAPAQTSSFAPKPLGSATPAQSGPVPPQGEAALLKAWHAQQKEIEDLKKKIAQLEGR